MSGCLLLGDVMAALAECQNRQECGVDRWAGVRHYTGQFSPVPEQTVDLYEYRPILQEMADDVSVKVAVSQAWGSGVYPAFSLRRVHPREEPRDTPAGSPRFLHEMIVHEMVYQGDKYMWSRARRDGKPGPRLCGMREYEANLLAVESLQAVERCQPGYLEECSRVFRLLSDI